MSSMSHSALSPRIAHVPRHFSSTDWDGPSSVIYHLCEQQIASGCRAEIHTSDALSKVARETWRHIPVYRYPRSYPFALGSAGCEEERDRRGDDFMSVSLYRALCRLRDVRVFHAHTLGRLGGAALVAARRQKRPFVLTLHGAMIRQAQEASQREERGGWGLGRAFSWYFRADKILEEADAVVCTSQHEYEQTCSLLGKERVHLLPNGVSPEHLRGGNPYTLRHRLGIDKDAFVFGCISRIAPEKNQLLAVEALARLRQRGINAVLIIAGPIMDEPYWQKIRHRVLELRLHEHCHLLPPVQLESPAHHNLLAALDCFLLPSVKELFGLVVLEAWAGSRPVVASDVGGLSHLVSHGSDGLLFESQNAESLTAALERFATEPDFRASCAQNGMKKVLAHYTWEKIAARQEHIYRVSESMPAAQRNHPRHK